MKSQAGVGVAQKTSPKVTFNQDLNEVSEQLSYMKEHARQKEQ